MKIAIPNLMNARRLVASMVAGFLGCQAMLALGQPEQAYAVVPEGTDARGGIGTGFNEARAARDAEAATARRQASRALYQSVVQYELASGNTQEEYAVIAAAVLAAKEGRNASQIIETIGEMRQAVGPELPDG